MENKQESLVFTPSAVLDLLMNIEELKELDISLTETLDNKLILSVGDSDYVLEDKEAEVVEVEPEVVEEVESTNIENYQDMIEDSVIENDNDIIEGGILKEAAKSLLLGGLIRFASKRLLK